MILWFRDLSLTLRGALETFGAVTIFFLDIVARSPRTFVRRFRLVVAQIYNAGTLRLQTQIPVIIGRCISEIRCEEGNFSINGEWLNFMPNRRRIG